MTARLDCVVDFELTVEGVVGTDTAFFFFFVGGVRTTASEGAFAGDFGTATAFDVPGGRFFFALIVGRFFFGIDVALPAANAEPEVAFFLRDLPMMKGGEARNSGTIQSIDATATSMHAPR